MTTPPSSRAPAPGPAASPWARAASALLWYVVPAVAVTLVLAYIGLAVAWRANPPVVPVLGGSMRPALHAGDLAFIKGVNPRTLRKGDVIGFRVPQALQEKYDVPATYIHRIVRAEHGADGSAFRTQGDAVGGADPFWTRDANVVGKVVGHAPGGGYPILFFRSQQGQLFVAIAALIGLIYFLLGVLDRRREFAELNVLTMAQIVDEARMLKDAMAHQAGVPRAPPAVVAPTHAGLARADTGEAEAAQADTAQADTAQADTAPLCSRGCHVLPPTAKFDPHTGEALAALEPTPMTATAAGSKAEAETETSPPTSAAEPFATVPSSRALVPYTPGAQPPPIDFSKLEEEIHRAVGSSEDVQGTVRELAGAISDYGKHLQSHTEVMKNLAASTGELHAATAEMRELLASLTLVVKALVEQQLPPAEQP
jgi:signal peptidase